MIYSLLAGIVLILHFCFALFVIFGGLLVLYRRWFIRLHLPALFWGILVELLRLPCPLTTLENYFAQLGGAATYAGDFIPHYISLIIYPGVTPQIMTTLGVLLIAFNSLIYLSVFRQTRQLMKV